MADDEFSKVSGGADRYASGSDQAWTALGYLIGGMVVWGVVGLLVDRWLHLGGVATGIGIVLGAAGGIVLIVRKLAVPIGPPGSDGPTMPDGREEDEDGERRR
jgi:F0F1-type ATP synthase assembly protein I